MSASETSERLRLRPVARRDFGAVAALLRHPAVRRYLCDDRVLDATTVRGLLRPRAAPLGLRIIMTADARFAGIAGLMPVDPGIARGTPVAGMIEPVVAVVPTLQARGIGVGALRLLMAQARAAVGVTALAAMADAPNLASRRMLARAGFVEVGMVERAPHPIALYRAALA